MSRSLVQTHRLLLPLSWLYGAAVAVRNWMYDRGFLASRRFDLPVIGIGNITVGGTGKTPHTEYLVRLLSGRWRVAVLSRGYKRRSHGYLLAEMTTPMEQMGDEPWQMKQKFGSQIHVAVDANRCRGIERLRSDKASSDVEVVLLDDAFQHRAVIPGLSILLIDYNRLITDDLLLPAGRLREPASGRDRADIIVVSKCPARMSPLDFRAVESSLSPRPYQSLFFSTLRYGTLRQLFGTATRQLDSLRTEQIHTLLITGIGSPRQMEADLRPYCSHIVPLSFPDHHYYTPSDVARINAMFSQMEQPRMIVTTEKDAARLRTIDGLSQEVRDSLYELPIEVEIMRNEATLFNQKILNYVQQNT